MRLPSSSAGQAWLMRAPIAAPAKLPSTRQRTLLALAALIACFVAIAAQLLRLGLKAEADLHLNIAEPIGQSWSRPDIVDRHGAAARDRRCDPLALCRSAVGARYRRGRRETHRRPRWAWIARKCAAPWPTGGGVLLGSRAASRRAKHSACMTLVCRGWPSARN